MTIAIGESLPEAKFKEKTADGPVEISTTDLFKGKKVVLFAVPGAFTPTCSLNHLPGYLDNREALIAKGVDDIAVLAVNDWHVMGAWAQQSGGMGKIHFLADWDAPSPRHSASMQTFPPAVSASVRSAIPCSSKTAW